jgi:hypothetical protein
MPVKCPYGDPGDILFVRETHFRFGRWVKNGTTKRGKQAWKFEPHGGIEGVRFLDNEPQDRKFGVKDRGFGWYKRPSLFLPKEFSRIWLVNDGVKVERLHSITEADAAREGADRFVNCHPRIRQYKGYGFCFRSGFLQIWLDINGVESWNKNPWCWAIDFRVLSTTGRPATFPKKEPLFFPSL